MALKTNMLNATSYIKWGGALLREPVAINMVNYRAVNIKVVFMKYSVNVLFI